MPDINPQDVANNLKIVATDAANLAMEAKSIELKGDITTGNAALETKAVALETKVDAQAVEIKAGQDANTLLQGSFDDLKKKMDERKNDRVASKTELEDMLDSKAADLKSLAGSDASPGVILDLKDFNASAGAASAPYSDYRVTPIKYDPNYYNRAANYIPTMTTGQDGAIRHTFETAETDSTANKVKGAQGTQSSVTLTDFHTPVQTVFNPLTLPKEWMNDVKKINSYLTKRLMANLLDHLDVQVFRGDGTGVNLKGFSSSTLTFASAAARQTYAGSLASNFDSTSPANHLDVLRVVKAGLANTNYMGKTVLLNPIDVATIDLLKATTNEYILHQINNPDGTISNFWRGIRIVECPAQASGTFTIFDPKALDIWMREGATVRFGYNGNDWTSNNITAIAEMRCAITPYNQKGIIQDTFAAWKTALDA